jgi:hypothetical protein
MTSESKRLACDVGTIMTSRTLATKRLNATDRSASPMLPGMAPMAALRQRHLGHFSRATAGGQTVRASGDEVVDDAALAGFVYLAVRGNSGVDDGVHPHQVRPGRPGGRRGLLGCGASRLLRSGVELHAPRLTSIRLAYTGPTMVTYEQLSIRRIINATCHHTAYGGSVMWPEVIDAMVDARRSCVDMHALHAAASAFISRYTHAEASYVASGCAACVQVGAAAILTDDDKLKMAALPHTAGLMKNEFVGPSSTFPAWRPLNCPGPLFRPGLAKSDVPCERRDMPARCVT